MVISFPSTHDEAAIHRDGLTSHVACGITAKPQNSISNLLGATNPSHRDALFHRLEGFTLAGRDHLVGHRCPNEPRAYGIDSNAPRSVFESCALGEPNYSVLGGVVEDRKSTRLNSSHSQISYAVFCLKKKKTAHEQNYEDHNPAFFPRLFASLPPLSPHTLTDFVPGITE